MFPSATCGRGRFAFPAAFPVGIRPFRTAGHLRQGAVNEACCRVKWRLYHYTLICQFKNRLFRPDSTMRAGAEYALLAFCAGFPSVAAPLPRTAQRDRRKTWIRNETARRQAGAEAANARPHARHTTPGSPNTPIQGHLVPPRSILKTPEQIVGIRESGKINIAVLDHVAGAHQGGHDHRRNRQAGF